MNVATKIMPTALGTCIERSGRTYYGEWTVQPLTGTGYTVTLVSDSLTLYATAETLELAACRATEKLMRRGDWRQHVTAVK